MTQVPHECVLLTTALMTYHQRVAVDSVPWRELARMIDSLVLGTVATCELNIIDLNVSLVSSSLKAQIVHKAVEIFILGHHTTKQDYEPRE